MDFIISEEATTFSRDYLRLKKMIPGHFLALKWHKSWYKKMEKLSLENTDECSY